MVAHSISKPVIITSLATQLFYRASLHHAVRPLVLAKDVVAILTDCSRAPGRLAVLKSGAAIEGDVAELEGKDAVVGDHCVRVRTHAARETVRWSRCWLLCRQFAYFGGKGCGKRCWGRCEENTFVPTVRILIATASNTFVVCLATTAPATASTTCQRSA